jgi:hypothetical protein
MGTHVDGLTKPITVVAQRRIGFAGLRAAHDRLPLIATRNTIGKPPGADGYQNSLPFGRIRFRKQEGRKGSA